MAGDKCDETTGGGGGARAEVWELFDPARAVSGAIRAQGALGTGGLAWGADERAEFH